MQRVPACDVAALLPSKVDIFLTCASFERRCLTISQQISSQQVRRAILCENDSLAAIRRDYADELQTHFGPNGEPVVFRRDSPLDIADKLRAALEPTDERGRSILVDITTFTHEALLILVRVLQIATRKHDRVFFTYAGAREYSVGSEGQEKWLSKGISEIRSVLGYPGVILPSKRVHLIILTGFETERAAKLVDAFEPGVVSLGFVTTAEDDAKNYESSRTFQQAFLEKYVSADVFRFPCFDIVETKKAVRLQREKHPEYNTVIAAMNTKVSTVAVALAALEQPAIQLCYALANEYNYSGYSLPADYCYWGEVTVALAATREQ
jgi:hypothetical protein